VKRLPFVLIVGEGTNRFNLVHADLYDSDCNDQVLHDSDLDRLAEQWSDFDWDTPPDRYPYFAQHFLWSRVVAGLPEVNATPSFLPGLSPTFCGHTIVFSVRPVRSHIFIDTGAFLASDATDASGIFGLTLADVTHRKFHFMAFPDQPNRIMTCELRWPR
jgi:serine/threonine protein phosphatase 1